MRIFERAKKGYTAFNEIESIIESSTKKRKKSLFYTRRFDPHGFDDTLGGEIKV